MSRFIFLASGRIYNVGDQIEGRHRRHCPNCGNENHQNQLTPNFAVPSVLLAKERALWAELGDP